MNSEYNIGAPESYDDVNDQAVPDLTEDDEFEIPQEALISDKTKNKNSLKMRLRSAASTGAEIVLKVIDDRMIQRARDVYNCAFKISNLPLISQFFPRTRIVLDTVQATVATMEFVRSGIFTLQEMGILEDRFHPGKKVPSRFDFLRINMGLTDFNVKQNEIINPQLFKKRLPDVLQIKSILFVPLDPMAPLVEKDFNEFLASISAEKWVIGKYNVGEPDREGNMFEFIAVKFTSDKISQVWSTCNETKAQFILDMNKAILNDLKTGYIEIGKKHNAYYDDWESCVDIVEFNPPEFYDHDLFNEIDTVVKNSIKHGLKTGILMYGDAGLSKTSTVNAVLQSNDCLKIRVTNSGYTSAKKLLEGIKTNKIVLIDDVDTDENSHKTRENAELLNFLDSNCYNVVILVVNSVNLMRPLIRSGRCDVKVKCIHPNYDKRKQTLNDMANKYGFEECPNEAIVMSEGLTHADLHNVAKTRMRLGLDWMDAVSNIVSSNKLLAADVKSEKETGSFTEDLVEDSDSEDL